MASRGAAKERQRGRFFAAAGIKKKRLTRRARTDILRAGKRREAAAGLTEVESTTCRAGVVIADRLGTGMSGRSAFLRCRLLVSSLALGAFFALPLAGVLASIGRVRFVEISPADLYNRGVVFTLVGWGICLDGVSF